MHPQTLGLWGKDVSPVAVKGCSPWLPNGFDILFPALLSECGKHAWGDELCSALPEGPPPPAAA